MLPGLVSDAGGLLTGTESLPDAPGTLYDALSGCESDVIAVCGASSAGPADHLAAVLTALGARILVQGVACRPGHPQALAQLTDGRWVVGLPGNPVPALAATATLLAPLLARSAGRPAHRKHMARLHGMVAPHPSDTRLVAVAWTDSTVRPVGHDNPAALWLPT